MYSWTNRRRFMYGIALFCAVVITWVLYKDMDSGPAETAVTFSFITLISMVGSYVFGAAWQDVNNMKINSGRSVVNNAAPPIVAANIQEVQKGAE